MEAAIALLVSAERARMYRNDVEVVHGDGGLKPHLSRVQCVGAAQGVAILYLPGVHVFQLCLVLKRVRVLCVCAECLVV